MLLAFTQGGDPAVTFVAAYMVADSFKIGDFAASGAATSNLPNLGELGDNLAVDVPQPLVDALAAADLVPPGGESVYAEDTLFFGLTPGLQIDPKTATEYNDFVMSAVISLRVLQQGDVTFCGLITRATTDGDALNTFLAVGPTELNTVYVVDKYDPAADPFFYETQVLDADFYGPQHVLYIVRGINSRCS